VGGGLLLSGAGSIVLVVAAGEGPAAYVAVHDRPVNASATNLVDIRSYSSPALARDPRDGDVAVATRIDSPDYSCSLHVSDDGGETFEQLAVPAPPGHAASKCYAPDVTYGDDGTLYFAFVTLEGRGNTPSGAWLSTLPDGASALSSPRPIAGPLTFQLSIAADPRDAARLYVAWLQASVTGSFSFPETGNPIVVSSSSDGGATWSEPHRVSGPERARALAPSLALDPAGRLYVAYLDLLDDALDYGGAHAGRGGEPYPGPWQLVVARSVDGQTFEEATIDDLVPIERIIVFTPPRPSIAAGPQGDVHVAFHSAPFGDPDVFVWSSYDRGRRWSAAVRVNDTRTRDGSTQELPALGVAEDGRVDVAYLDRRLDGSDVMTDVRLQSSFDGGASFGPSLRVNDVSFDHRFALGVDRGLPDQGSRLGLLSRPAGAFVAWSDARAGSLASLKRDIAIAYVALPAPGLLRRARGWLTVVAVAATVAGVVVMRSRSVAATR
jgi:hypothetical protein